jgi:hypothetical protein
MPLKRLIQESYMQHSVSTGVVAFKEWYSYCYKDTPIVGGTNNF